MHTVVGAHAPESSATHRRRARIRICRVDAHARKHRGFARARIARGSNPRAGRVGKGTSFAREA